MKSFAKAGMFISIFNILLCLFFLLYGYIRPDDIRLNTDMNDYGCVCSFLSITLCILLQIVFRISNGGLFRNSEMLDSLANYNNFEAAINIVIMLHAFFRFFVCGRLDPEEGDMTAYKLMASFSLSLCLNYYTFIMMKGYSTLKNSDKNPARKAK